MNPLHWILRRGHCRCTHQYFAFDALPLVQTTAGQRLVTWLLRYYPRYLRGAIDPDIRYRDFQNQVIHVDDGYWGGAPRVAHQWYDRLQRYLRQRRYSDAAHAAGVLSHYFTDPLQPLNTAYSPAEAVIHRPLQWSVDRDYDAIRRRWQDDQLRVVFQFADGPGWLGAAMLHGAKYAHGRFETLVRSYRLDAAIDDPPAGLTPHLRVVFAELFGLAITGWARVLERAADDAEAVLRATADCIKRLAHDYRGAPCPGNLLAKSHPGADRRHANQGIGRRVSAHRQSAKAFAGCRRYQKTCD